MDATYKDMVTAQVEANALIDLEIKDDLLKVLNRFSENDLKELSKDEKNRFFYKNGFNDVAKKIKDEMPPTLKKYYQKKANAAARAGTEIDNKFVSQNFETTYTRGGHKYVNGVRKY